MNKKLYELKNISKIEEVYPQVDEMLEYLKKLTINIHDEYLEDILTDSILSLDRLFTKNKDKVIHGGYIMLTLRNYINKHHNYNQQFILIDDFKLYEKEDTPYIDDEIEVKEKLNKVLKNNLNKYEQQYIKLLLENEQEEVYKLLNIDRNYYFSVKNRLITKLIEDNRIISDKITKLERVMMNFNNEKIIIETDEKYLNDYEIKFLKFFENETPTEIAKKLNITQAYCMVMRKHLNNKMENKIPKKAIKKSNTLYKAILEYELKQNR